MRTDSRGIYRIASSMQSITRRDESSKKVTSKAAYTCLGVELSGRKDLLGLWVGEAEGANFWLMF